MDSKEYVLSKMRDVGLRAAETLQASAPELDGTALIDREEDIPDFDPDACQYLKWETGQAVKDSGQVWKLLQPYDSTIYKEHPAELRAQWGLMHTKNPLRAKPYVAPLGTSGVYMKDECCTEGGKAYRSTIDNNAWAPSAYPQGWGEVTT